MSRSFSRALLCLITLPLVTCDRVPLTAPTGSTLTLSASTTRLQANETATITAVVVEASGTAPQNGTMVTFTASLGAMEPQEAPTANGLARATFRAGSTSGTARINALSGGTSNEEVLEILVGGAGTSAVLVRAEPSSVPNTGGTVTIIATVTDEVGNRLAGLPVTFSADNGRLSSGAAVTDGNGEARTTLTTNATTVVTAAAGGQTGTFTVNAIDQGAVAVTLTATPNPVAVAGQQGLVTFAAQATAPTGSSIVSYRWSFGDGSPSRTTTGGGTTHRYSTPGTYHASVVVRASNGAEGSGEIEVRVIPTAAVAAADQP